ncbi:MAG: M23 family metallopeptidase [Gemmatimonadota bacterium]|nr:M23 family metallopeptidase [Gemmatimonadota bacterium]
MTAQPVVRRRVGASALLLTASLACVDVQERAPDKVVTDSAGGSVATATTPAPVRGSFGADSAISVRGAPAPEEIVLALRNDTAHMLDVVDSTPAAVPSDADLATLRREMIVPVAGVAASALYDSYDEVRGGTRKHEALDIPVPRGTPVVSSTNGRVLKLFNSKAGGLMVYAADSTEHFILMYGHLDAYQPGLADGQPLRRGQQIGVVGTTGNATPTVPHLHFAVARSSDVKQWWKGAPVNPYPLLR